MFCSCNEDARYRHDKKTQIAVKGVINFPSDQPEKKFLHASDPRRKSYHETKFVCHTKSTWFKLCRSAQAFCYM